MKNSTTHPERRTRNQITIQFYFGPADRHAVDDLSESFVGMATLSDPFHAWLCAGTLDQLCAERVDAVVQGLLGMLQQRHWLPPAGRRLQFPVSVAGNTQTVAAYFNSETADRVHLDLAPDRGDRNHLPPAVRCTPP